MTDDAGGRSPGAETGRAVSLPISGPTLRVGSRLLDQGDSRSVSALPGGRDDPRGRAETVVRVVGLVLPGIQDLADQVLPRLKLPSSGTRKGTDLRGRPWRRCR